MRRPPAVLQGDAESFLPWNHHVASLRLAFGRFSGLRDPFPSS